MDIKEMKKVNIKSLTKLYLFKSEDVNDNLADNIIELHRQGFTVKIY